MEGNAQSHWMDALAASAAVPMKNGQGSSVLLSIGLALLCLRGISMPVEMSFEADDPHSLLSHYLLDTEFLAQCARADVCKMEQLEVIAPEIRLAILALIAGEEQE